MSHAIPTLTGPPNVDRLDDHAAQFLAIENGTPVGTIRLVHPPASATFKLGRLAVRKQGRGKGTAQKLIAALEERAKELGGTEVYSGAQVPVRLLYEKAGYHVVDEEGYLDEGQPHVMMMKSLT